MNRVKALFVVLYFFSVVFIAVGAIFNMAVGGFSRTWLGALITTLPFLVFYLVSAVTQSPRTSNNLPVISVIVAAGFALSVYDFLITGSGRAGALTATVIASVGFVLFNFWYSRFGRGLNPLLKPGEQMPTIAAEDIEGNSVSSEDLLGQPALYMFYRGNWCPFCSSQVRELTRRYRDIIDRGVEVALISPQPADFTKRVADQFEVPFRFWVDRDLRAARALNILNPDGVPVGQRGKYGADTVLPTTVITDAKGRIIYTDQTDNYRVRPKPSRFLRALSEHGF